MRRANLFLALGAVFCGLALFLGAAMPSTITPAQWWWMPLLWSSLEIGIVGTVLAAIGFWGEYVRRRNRK